MLDRELEGGVALGLGLSVFGVIFALYSHLILLNVPFTALGLACVILGATVIMTPSTPVPTETVRAMVEGACVNVEALLEEFDAREAAVYLPPREGRVYAYVPLSSNPGLESRDLGGLMDAPIRVLRSDAGRTGLTVFPPGAEIVRLSGLDSEVGLEDALTHVLVDFLEAVKSVKAVREGDSVVVDIEGPRLETDFTRYHRVLGSLPTSIAACTVTHVTDTPVRLVQENQEDDTVRAIFRLLSHG